MGWATLFMVDTFPVAILVATVLGTLSGLGTGGGSLLILWLGLVVGVDPTLARSINLMFFIPSALIACLFRWKQGKLRLQKILPAMIAGSIASGIFTNLGLSLNTQVLQKLFGILLLFTGVRDLLYKPKRQ